MNLEVQLTVWNFSTASTKFVKPLVNMLRILYGAEVPSWPEQEVAKMKNSKVLISVLFPRVFPA
jgi:hypothetical protein